MIPIYPKRGRIYGKGDVEIASYVPSFKLVTEKFDKEIYEGDIKIIASALKLNEKDLEIIDRRIKNSSKRTPSSIIYDLTFEQIAILEELKPYLNCSFIDMEYRRSYNYPFSCAHIVGYAAKASKTEIAESGSSFLDIIVGKSGIEKYYEDSLRGDFGFKKVEVNAYGKTVRRIDRTDSKPGADLTLNIDALSQEWAFDLYLKNKKGSCCVMMDCGDGSLVSMSSSPSFDPNYFSKLSEDYWKELGEDPYKPLINKAIHSYPPGSAFKIVTIIAALENGIDPYERIFCDSSPFLGGEGFRCHKAGGHGSVDAFDALRYSCNSYIYKIAKTIGPGKIMETARKLGFGEKTGIDLDGESAGFLPSESWKKKRFKSDWSLGDTLNLSIGQGFTLATPLQLARMSCALASGGKLYRPSVVSGDSYFSESGISRESLDFIGKAMRAAVNEPGGTAYYARIPDQGFIMAGKTGTTQVRAKRGASDDLSRESLARIYRNHASFIGFAPYEKPKYSIALFVEHGGSGGRVAAPMAMGIMKKFLDSV